MTAIGRSGTDWSVGQFLPQRSFVAHYSITCVARTAIVGGIVRPSAFADFIFTASSKFIGCSIGRVPQ